MTSTSKASARKPSTVRRWIRRGFVAWALISSAWLANSVRTQGVDPALLKSNASVLLVGGDTVLEFLPTKAKGTTALIFFCGSGIAAEAYAPFLHPIAEAGYRVYVVRLPLRFAPLESHKQEAIDRAIGLIHNHPEISRWVISGHSLGAALVCRAMQSNDSRIVGVVLIGTTHPKKDDISWIPFPVTKVYASKDGVAPKDDVLANKKLLPASTMWVEVDGGNHSQFGHYGHQLFDGTPTISRNEQQRIARFAIMDVLHRVEEGIVEQSHALEPAVGPDSNGKSSPPAQ